MENLIVTARDLKIGDRIKVKAFDLGRSDKYNVYYETTVTSLEHRVSGFVHARCIGGEFIVIGSHQFKKCSNDVRETAPISIPNTVRRKGLSVD